MSRIGRSPITVPTGVDVNISDDNVVTVKGPKGTLTQAINPDIKIEYEGTTINITRPTDTPKHRSMHGLSRTLINNMGVGYRAVLEGNKLVMNLGYSHQVIMEPREGLTVDVPAPNKIIVSGIDRQAVGQLAAEIRRKRPPEPYMGKGIKYADEVIRRKEGKSGVK